jgi:hypothetical protein
MEQINKWINLKTGEIYNNRKEAKIKLGHTVFNKMYSHGEIKFFHEDSEMIESAN